MKKDNKEEKISENSITKEQLKIRESFFKKVEDIRKKKMLRDVTVSIKPFISAETKDNTNICMIIGESDIEIKPFLVDDLSYTDILAELAADNEPESKLVKEQIPLALDNITAAFSTQINQRKRFITVGFAKDGNDGSGITNWVDFFDQREINTSLYFGFIHYVTGRKWMKSFEDFSSYCNSKTIFYSFYEDDTSIETLPKQDFLMAFTHKQKNSDGDEINGFLQAIALPTICFNLQNNPNYNTYNVLNGTVNLNANIFTEAKRKEYEDLHINQYFDRNGLTRLRLGVTTIGKKIEEIYCMNVFIPKDLQSRLETFQANTDLKVSDSVIFSNALSGMLQNYEDLRITAPSQVLNGFSYQINEITTTKINNIAQFNAKISIAYNDNIVNIVITGQQVEVINASL